MCIRDRYLKTGTTVFRALPAPAPLLRSSEAGASSGSPVSQEAVPKSNEAGASSGSHAGSSTDEPSGPRSEQRLKAAATDIWHLTTHRCTNPFCADCQIAKMQHKGAYRQNALPPDNFGDEVPADHIISWGDSIGVNGEEYAVAMLDRATKWI